MFYGSSPLGSSAYGSQVSGLMLISVTDSGTGIEGAETILAFIFANDNGTGYEAESILAEILALDSGQGLELLRLAGNTFYLNGKITDDSKVFAKIKELELQGKISVMPAPTGKVSEEELRAIIKEQSLRGNTK